MDNKKDYIAGYLRIMVIIFGIMTFFNLIVVVPSLISTYVVTDEEFLSQEYQRDIVDKCESPLYPTDLSTDQQSTQEKIIPIKKTTEQIENCKKEKRESLLLERNSSYKTDLITLLAGFPISLIIFLVHGYYLLRRTKKNIA